MNALYGVRDYKTSTKKEEELVCPNCDSIGTTEIQVSIVYFYVFGTPFMPIAKKGTSKCHSCNLTLDHKSFKEPITGHFNAQVTNSKTPIKLFALTILLSLLMVLAIVLSVAQSSDNGLRFLDQPKTSDGYVFVEENGKLVEWTLDEVESDRFTFSSFDKESDGIIFKKYTKQELIGLKNNDLLVKINRPD